MSQRDPYNSISVACQALTAKLEYFERYGNYGPEGCPTVLGQPVIVSGHGIKAGSPSEIVEMLFNLQRLSVLEWRLMHIGSEAAGLKLTANEFKYVESGRDTARLLVQGLREGKTTAAEVEAHADLFSKLQESIGNTRLKAVLATRRDECAAT